MDKLMGHYSDLAQQKFSSNVVEKCLKLGGPSLAEARERVIRELVASPVMARLLQVDIPTSARWGGMSIGLLKALQVHCCITSPLLKP